MKICIATSTGLGLRYKLEVQPSITIQELKERFVKNSNNKKDIQSISFAFDEEILNDNDSTIASYGIEDKSIIDCVDLVVTARTGFSLGAKFVDIDNMQGFKRVDWSRRATGASWRRARHGLNLEGFCGNNQCEAYKHRVVIPIGYGVFDIHGGVDETTSKCPVCKRYVEPITCSLNNCWWKFKATKFVQGRDPKQCSGDWQYADDAYHQFDERISGMAEWKKLIFDIVKHKPIE
ncbi:unnamed protein product [Adineta steineri]|uniref:Ubiquitin-like domain-containing protein n=1 Tax=Adineta steineri TaxID=433720 RepID=A0A819TCN2_9BILA|nr:unnamed protein product [Adineta steineri]CAF4079478.1 unnamed protein product [Adineta steineri]